MITRTASVLAVVLLTATAAHAQRGGGGGGGGGGLGPGGPAAGQQTALAKSIADEQARAKAAVDAMDTNKDGTVSPDEYRTAQLADFTKLDANGDGKLTPDEMSSGRGGGGRGGRGGAPSGPVQLTGDTNKDGALSLAEFTANIDKDYKTIDKDWNNKITPLEMAAKVRTQSAGPAMNLSGGGGGGF